VKPTKEPDQAESPTISPPKGARYRYFSKPPQTVPIRLGDLPLPEAARARLADPGLTVDLPTAEIFRGPTPGIALKRLAELAPQCFGGVVVSDEVVRLPAGRLGVSYRLVVTREEIEELPQLDPVAPSREVAEAAAKIAVPITEVEDLKTPLPDLEARFAPSEKEAVPAIAKVVEDKKPKEPESPKLPALVPVPPKASESGGKAAGPSPAQGVESSAGPERSQQAPDAEKKGAFPAAVEARAGSPEELEVKEPAAKADPKEAKAPATESSLPEKAPATAAGDEKGSPLPKDTSQRPRGLAAFFSFLRRREPAAASSPEVSMAKEKSAERPSVPPAAAPPPPSLSLASGGGSKAEVDLPKKPDSPEPPVSLPPIAPPKRNVEFPRNNRPFSVLPTFRRKEAESAAGGMDILPRVEIPKPRPPAFPKPPLSPEPAPVPTEAKEPAKVEPPAAREPISGVPPIPPPLLLQPPLESPVAPIAREKETSQEESQAVSVAPPLVPGPEVEVASAAAESKPEEPTEPEKPMVFSPESAGETPPEAQADKEAGLALSAGSPAQENLQEVFMTEDFLSVEKVIALCSDLPGIKSCILAHGAAVLASHNVPEDIDLVSLSGNAMEMLKSMRDSASRMGIGEVPAVTIHSEKGPITFFHRDDLCLLVLHKDRGFLPGVREKIQRVVDELASVSQPRLEGPAGIPALESGK